MAIFLSQGRQRSAPTTLLLDVRWYVLFVVRVTNRVPQDCTRESGVWYSRSVSVRTTHYEQFQDRVSSVDKVLPYMFKPLSRVVTGGMSVEDVDGGVHFDYLSI